MKKMIDVAMKEWYVEHEGGLSQKVDEITFKTDVMIDDQYATMEKIESISRVVQAAQNEVSPISTIEAFSPEIVTSIARRAVQALLNQAGELRPDIFTFEASEALTDTVQNIKSTSAAIATTLHITHDRVSSVFQTELCCTASTSLSAKEALRFYNQIYWLTRDTLITIAHTPGPWCRNTTDQQTATTTLRHLIHNLAESSNTSVRVSNGDGYAGVTETAVDRWLPAITFSSSLSHPQPLLSLSPRVLPSNTRDCTLALTCWFNFFGHKYPFLILHEIPLHACPRYPDPFTNPTLVTTNIADEVQDTRISGYDSVQILISWIGRAVLASTAHEDEDIAKTMASSALTTMIDIRADLCNAVDGLTRAELTSSAIVPLRAFDIASEFLEHVLISLKGHCVDERHSIVPGIAASISRIAAGYWLPRVEISMPTSHYLSYRIARYTPEPHTHSSPSSSPSSFSNLYSPSAFFVDLTSDE